MVKWRGILKIVLFDVLGYVIAMGIFLAIFYLVPNKLTADGTVVGDTDNMAQFEVPIQFEENGIEEGKGNSSNVITDIADSTNDNSKDSNNNSDSDDASNNSTSGNKKNNKRPSSSKNTNKNGSNSSSNGNRDHLGTEEIENATDEISYIENVNIEETVLEEYATDNVSLTIEMKTMGSGDDRITFYVADVYVSSLNYLKTAFAENEYGINIKQDVDELATDNKAIFAMTGDSYGNNTTGIVIRDGILYRDDENDADVCLLYTDGTMRTYKATEFDEESVKEDNVWQAWCFGPSLLDGSGNVLTEFVTSTYLNKTHPRAAIGYVAPGHYVFVLVDGRDEGYSRGVTISELAAIMRREGCLAAYNLDGGGSATMYYNGEYINQSTGRDVSDIIYIPIE